MDNRSIVCLCLVFDHAILNFLTYGHERLDKIVHFLLTQLFQTKLFWMFHQFLLYSLSKCSTDNDFIGPLIPNISATDDSIIVAVDASSINKAITSNSPLGPRNFTGKTFRRMLYF